jgi:preprotein translocase subunit SecG
VHALVPLLLVLLVLLHSGRDGELSDLLGGSTGASAARSTVMERNLDRITVVIAVLFSFTTVILALRLQ